MSAHAGQGELRVDSPSAPEASRPRAVEPEDLHVAFRASPCPVLVTDREGRLLATNPVAREVFSIDPASHSPRLWDLAGPDHKDELLAKFVEVVRSKIPTDVRVSISGDDGVRVVDLQMRALVDKSGSTTRVLIVGTERTREIDNARLTEMISSAADALPWICVVASEQGDVIWCNQSTKRLCGSEIRRVVDVLDEQSRDTFVEHVLPTLEAGSEWEGPLTVIAADRTKVPVAVLFASRRLADGGRFITIVARDLSEDPASVTGLFSFHDPLTGLPIRALVFDRLSQALERASRSQDYVAVFALDLDDFAAVQRSTGRSGGDELLRLVAGRLTAAIRPGDTVARMGGDEFLVVCEGIHEPAEALKIADRLRGTLARPFTVRGTPVQTSASIGVALAKDHRTSAKELVRRADTAVLRAKSAGGNQFVQYREEPDA
ncbi:MAG: hypothetical protein KatS3mg008_2069 [Acidimicrobiales bacterium]|nr:MAG: hypothetical protein KatS3mg008_2069 [Acidimicrobiales bacterium]